MKDLSSRSVAGRTGSDQNSSTTPDTAATSPGVTLASGTKACFKDPMFSSSDTDDCDADKLVIDLDAAGSTDATATSDSKPTAASVPVPTSAPSVSKSEPTKVRTEGSASKSSSGGSHRQQTSSGKSGSNQQSDGQQSSQPPTDKGLKMRIKCSQVVTGGPARHEISQFHTLVNSAVPSSSSSTPSLPSSACPSNSSASGAKLSCAERIVETDKDALVRIDRIPPPGVSGSHRKDHRTSVKERSTNNVKDRSTSEGQLHNPSASSGANVAQANSISVSPSSQPNNSLPVSCGTAVAKDGASEICAKSVAVDSDKETIVLAARNNAPSSQQDPYEFNVKFEESIVGRPSKKMKLDKYDAACSPMPGCLSSDTSTLPAETRDVSVDACHVGVVTDPDCLGPCEPGTTVTLEGIVWNETENGLLVVNVTWRGKTYVGTLMDATKHHWAPPRFATDSPTSDLDGRTPKGRGKRGRTCTAAARSEINCSDRKLRSNRCTASSAAKSGVSSAGSNSPVRSDAGPLGAPVAKRPRVSESQAGSSSSSSDVSRTALKQSRSESRMSTSADNESNGGDGVLIECPAPNCSKKYRHINGLRYHQSRSHPNTNFDDDVDDLDGDVKSAAVGSKIRSDIDSADLESASDIDKNEVGETLTGSSSHSNDATSKQEKKSKSDRSKSKSITIIKQSQVDIQDAPRSPSKSFTDDATNVEKHKYRKKDRERGKDGAVVDPSVETEVTVTGDAVKSSSMSASKKCETIVQAVSLNEIPGVEAEVAKVVGSVDDITAVNRCSETVSVIRSAAEVNSSTNALSNGELNLNVMQASCELSSIEDTVSAEKVDSITGGLSSSMFNAMDSSISSPGPILPSKRPKTTPTKFASEFENPHSPAYSDISDANDSAPMLEKEATPSSAAVDDDNLTTSGNSMVERCPVSQRLAENFTGTFNGLTSSSSLYGQPPCLTPAVVSPPSLDVPLQQVENVKVEKMDTSISNHHDERSGHSSSSRSMRPLIPPRISASDASRHPGHEIAELTERSLGSVQRTVSRSHGGDGSSPQPLQPAPTMLPPNIFMQYPYGPVPGGYPPLELMHPDYRAQFERLVQQGMMRRPDQPPSSMVRPALDLPPDFKGFPCAPKSLDVDRKSKNDGQLPGSLPTPPSLIPDRGSASYDEQDNRMGKLKGSERRDDGQRSSYPHQQYSAGSERQRRNDDSSSAKESGSNKPSAVVAPQARDRISSSSGSSKVRPDDSSRSSSSSHDQSRSVHKSTPKGSTTLQESPSSRQSKDSSDRCGRDDKQGVIGRSSYKKEDSGMSLSPITSVSLPLPSTYPPYYPYLPAQFDPATFYGGLNPMIGYPGAPPGPFLHPAQVGYLPPAAGDVGGMISPSVGPHLSPSDGKTGPTRGFYPGNDGAGSAPSTVHKIHELKEVAKGCSGSGGDSSQSVTGASTGSVLRDMRPESRGGVVGGSVGLPKDLDRAGTSSPPTQRHVHTHHHMHMLGPSIPPLFSGVFPSDPSMLSSSQAGSTPNNCPPLSRPFIGK